MSVSYIPEKIKIRLWGKTAGRCQYEGCNRPLWFDQLTKCEFNAAYIAHIVADKPGGPRGDPVDSDKLKKDLSNLMLMCDEHHRLIDREDVAGHSVERLKGMKSEHENRIETICSIHKDKESHIILYGANIGEHHVYLNWMNAAQAMNPQRYPAENKAIEISIKNSLFQDKESEYWEMERENLKRKFQSFVKPKFSNNEIKHLSIFAIAPQPLLIELGRLLSDIPASDVYQLHREPPGWSWEDHKDDIEYICDDSKSNNNIEKVALNISLSGSISDERITNVLGKDTSIWRLTINNPNNDFMKSQEQLSAFRRIYRNLLNKIKEKHGEKTILHVFPATPVSVAVEMGRVWMPKADMSLRIYNQTNSNVGFVSALDINTE